MRVSREQTLAYRWSVQRLDAAPGSVPLLDAAVLDLGVQDGPGSSGVLALVDRGVDVDAARAAFAGFTEETALLWTLRGAPHLYRRDDVGGVADAVAPFGSVDATKRIINAGKSLTAAGIDVREAMGILGGAMRAATGTPTDKGTVSAAVTSDLADPYLVDCRPCGARHPHEQAFRLSALAGGLELEPGTSPPVLRRLPGWPAKRVGPGDVDRAPARLDVVRGYLHLLGPATPKDVAAFLETTVGEVKQHWPDEVVEVDRTGTRAWILEADADALTEADPDRHTDEVRFLGPMDLFTAAKDRDLLVSKDRAKELWTALGRPGAIARGGELVGTWRPRATKGDLALRLTWWDRPDPAGRSAVDAAAELVARARSLRFVGFTD